MYKKSSECTKRWCSGHGVPVVQPSFFERPFPRNLPHEKIFEPKKCICNEDRMGKRCEKQADLNRIKQERAKSGKILAWTTISVSDRKLKRFRA